MTKSYTEGSNPNRRTMAGHLDRKQLRELMRRPSWITPTQTVATLATYTVLSFIGLIADSVILWPTVWLCQGFILSCFLGAAHDCAHGTFVRGRTLNRALGAFWASAVLFNFTIYKWYHLEHHRFTSVPGDTEPAGEFQDVYDYLRNLPTTGFFLSFWRMSWNVLRNRFPHFIRTERQRRDVIVDNRVLCGWLVLVAGGMWVDFSLVASVYLAPLVFYFPMVFLTSLPEHYGCDPGPDPFRNTRSVRSNAIYRFFFWNGNYHAEHHLYPQVPSWNLHRLHALIGHRFAHVARSYVGFHVSLLRSLLARRGGETGAPILPSKRVAYETYTNEGDAASKQKTGAESCQTDSL